MLVTQHIQKQKNQRTNHCLKDMQKGCWGRICQLRGDAELCQRMREMGFCEEMEVGKLSNGKNILCWIGGAKLAVAQEYAECVVVKNK